MGKLYDAWRRKKEMTPEEQRAAAVMDTIMGMGAPPDSGAEAAPPPQPFIPVTDSMSTRDVYEPVTGRPPRVLARPVDNMVELARVAGPPMASLALGAMQLFKPVSGTAGGALNALVPEGEEEEQPFTVNPYLYGFSSPAMTAALFASNPNWMQEANQRPALEANWPALGRLAGRATGTAFIPEKYDAWWLPKTNEGERYHVDPTAESVWPIAAAKGAYDSTKGLWEDPRAFFSPKEGDFPGYEAQERIWGAQHPFGNVDLPHFPKEMAMLSDMATWPIQAAPVGAALRGLGKVGGMAGRAANPLRRSLQWGQHEVNPIRLLGTTFGQHGFGIEPIDPLLSGTAHMDWGGIPMKLPARTKAYFDYIFDHPTNRRENFRDLFRASTGSGDLLLDRVHRLEALTPEALESIRVRRAQISPKDPVRDAEDEFLRLIEESTRNGIPENLPEIEKQALENAMAATDANRRAIVSRGGQDPDLGQRAEWLRRQAMMSRNNAEELMELTRRDFPGLDDDAAWRELANTRPQVFDVRRKMWEEEKKKVQGFLQEWEEWIGREPKMTPFDVKEGFLPRTISPTGEVGIDVERALEKMAPLKVTGMAYRTLGDIGEDLYNFLWSGAGKAPKRTGIATTLAGRRMDPYETTQEFMRRIYLEGSPEERVAMEEAFKKGTNAFSSYLEARDAGNKAAAQMVGHLELIDEIVRNYGVKPRTEAEAIELARQGWKKLGSIEKGPLKGFQKDIGEILGEHMLPADLVAELKLMARNAEPLSNNVFSKFAAWWKPFQTVVRPGFWVRNILWSKYLMAIHGATDPLNDLAGMRVVAARGSTEELKRILKVFEDTATGKTLNPFRAVRAKAGAARALTNMKASRRAMNAPADLGISRAQLGMDETAAHYRWRGEPARRSAAEPITDIGPGASFAGPGRAPLPWAEKSAPRHTIRPYGKERRGPVTWEDLRDAFVRYGIIQKGRVAEIGTRSLKGAGASYQAIEDALRASYGIHLLRQGKKMKEVSRLVERAFFNYGPEAFSRFEQGLRHYGILPFYGWMKNIPKLSGRLLFEKPEEIARLGEMMRIGQHEVGLDDYDAGEIAGFKRPFPGIMSPDQRERGGIPLFRQSGTTPQGDEYDRVYGLSYNVLGFGDTNVFGPRFFPRNQFLGGLTDLFYGALSQSGPVVQFPIVAGSNMNLLSGTPQGDFVTLPAWAGWLAPYSKGHIENYRGTVIGSPAMAYTLRLAGSFMSIPVNLSNPEDRTRVIQGINGLFGVPIFEMDLKQGERYYDARLSGAARMDRNRSRENTLMKQSIDRDLRIEEDLQR